MCEKSPSVRKTTSHTKMKTTISSLTWNMAGVKFLYFMLLVVVAAGLFWQGVLFWIMACRYFWRRSYMWIIDWKWILGSTNRKCWFRSEDYLSRVIDVWWTHMRWLSPSSIQKDRVSNEESNKKGERYVNCARSTVAGLRAKQAQLTGCCAWRSREQQENKSDKQEPFTLESKGDHLSKIAHLEYDIIWEGFA